MSEVLSELRAMETMWTALQSLQPSARQRAVSWLLGALDMTEEAHVPSVTPDLNLNGDGPSPQEAPAVQPTIPTTDMSPKAFISEKLPKTNVERMTCLAFYLTHYRKTPYFSGSDIEKLNRDAAGPNINPSRDLDNASKARYLAGAESRKRQITSRGEDLVNALPDREAVKEAMAKHRPQRKRRSASAKKSLANGDSE